MYIPDFILGELFFKSSKIAGHKAISARSIVSILSKQLLSPFLPLQFKVTMETLKTQALNVSVWHNDNFGRNSFLGEVDLDLSEWDFSNTQMNDYALKARVNCKRISFGRIQSVLQCQFLYRW